MPTRIVLQESKPPSRMAAAAAVDNGGLSAEDEYAIRQSAGTADGGAFSTPPRPGRTGTPTRVSSGNRRVVGFRSSILRDLSQPNHFDDDDDDDLNESGVGGGQDERGKQRRLQLHLSNEDIRASPRLLGYLFGAIASVVMLVSVVQFYFEEDVAWDEFNTEPTNNSTTNNSTTSKFPEDTFFRTINGPIYLWKLWCCIGVASFTSLLFLAVLVMHFDTICFPRTWFQFFRDGSLAERNLLLSMLVLNAGGLHINTSSFSVGEAQANVYFTSWIVFICTALNLGVWRKSAGLPRLAVKVLSHHRETTYNWCWTLIFGLITAGSATDMYLHRTEVTFRLKGEVLVLDFKSWMRVLSLVWSDVLCCCIAIFFNYFWTKTWKLKLSTECRFILNWRFLEGFLILTLMGMKFWIILTYTGVDGVINGLNNSYFGIWGSFFNTVFTFGTWLRENQDIDYII